MYLLAAYDVVSDKRRRRLQKALAGWLEPVQRSVFEGHILPNVLPPMHRAVTRVIDLSKDSVRIFSMCESCRRSARLYGVAAPLPDPSAPLFL